jgi:hypothetical protein
MVEKDEFLATRLFFLGPNFAKNKPEVKKFAFWRNFASKKTLRRTNRFWYVSLEHTLFLDFLKLFLNMRLIVSFAGKKERIFWTYGSKVMDV